MATILTCYLSGQRDSQTNLHVEPDQHELMSLVPGCGRLGVQLVIFHDKLSSQFMAEYPKVKFIKVPTPQKYSNNDYRFFLYRNWLALHRCKSVFCCDLFDCHVNNSPDDFLASIHPGSIAFSVVEGDVTNRMCPSGMWMKGKYKQCYGKVPDYAVGKPLLGAGCFGGHYTLMLRCLVLICREITKINKRRPCNSNMAAVNYVGYNLVPIWAEGHPFNSVFRSYDYEADVVFVHK